ncbi:hypothetical protein [Halomonas caseinilytica]|uniref:hypothetical protein n=1 Tax=Halomonas caseinilytica TaxID=438744 RepID=UPI0007E585DC|nr:hypothetical protein [Halomonas caseinilytica]SEM67708.1 hypothetical protein SAMN04487952_10614 [Halomonas caseinilytica]
MTIDTTIDQYRETKGKMQSIIDHHMSAAFEEIHQKFGATPTYVELRVEESQMAAEKYPNGVYAGCWVDLGGE